MGVIDPGYAHESSGIRSSFSASTSSWASTSLSVTTTAEGSSFSNAKATYKPAETWKTL